MDSQLALDIDNPCSQVPQPINLDGHCCVPVLSAPAHYPPRPRRSHPDVLRLTAEALLPEILAWQKEPSESEEDDLEFLIEVLQENISNLDNAYALARAMENKHFRGINNDLLGILEGAYFCNHEAHSQVVKDWVRKCNITPGLAVGSEGKSRIYEGKSKSWKILPGIVKSINLQEATFVLAIEEMGHVSQGLGCHGYILPFEEVLCVSCDQPAVRVKNIFLTNQ